MTKPDEAAMHQVRDILQRCVAAIDDLCDQCLMLEPSPRSRQRMASANRTRDEARLWLARWEKP